MVPERNIEEGREFTFGESIILKAQLAEYKTSAYFEKSSESLFGYISVLPGAFSIFRWEWINGKPLDKFLKGATDEFASLDKTVSCSTANMYLAEDRIWWLEILARDGNWSIGYLPSAVWLTDPPITFASLLKQRRRWYNGSVFALYYVLKNFPKLICCWKQRRRSIWSTLLLGFLYVYMLISSFIQFASIGSIYALFSITMRSVFSADKDPNFLEVANALENLFLVSLVLTIILASIIRIEWSQKYYWLISLIFGILMVFTIVVTFIHAVIYSEQII